MARLNDDLADIHSIMKQNIEEVLNRGEKLDREFANRFRWSWRIGFVPLRACPWPDV